MTIDPTIITILVEAAKAAGPLLAGFLEALTDDHREAVLDALERDTKALDAVPSTAEALASIAAMYERHRARVQAHEQGHANAIMERMRIAPTTELALRNLAASHTLSSEERVEVGIAHRLVRAALDGRLAITPGPLDPPTLPGAAPLPLALSGEPNHSED
jgi:hypothetical protein